MEHFYGGGGNNNPDFTYRFLVKTVPNEMYKWCEDYPLNGPFERWHFKLYPHDGGTTYMIQFESRKAAYMFKIAFSEHIIEDKTFSFAKDKDWQ